MASAEEEAWHWRREGGGGQCEALSLAATGTRCSHTYLWHVRAHARHTLSSLHGAHENFILSCDADSVYGTPTHNEHCEGAATRQAPHAHAHAVRWGLGVTRTSRAREHTRTFGRIRLEQVFSLDLGACSRAHVHVHATHTRHPRPDPQVSVSSFIPCPHCMPTHPWEACAQAHRPQAWFDNRTPRSMPGPYATPRPRLR